MKTALLICCTCFILLGCSKSKHSTHPALARPDGKSHRGDTMVGNTLTDPTALQELGRLYQKEKAFEARQEYLLRLLDYYLFSQNRLKGMKKHEVESVFGPTQYEDKNPSRVSYSGGRDSLVIDYKDNIVSYAQYIMSY